MHVLLLITGSLHQSAQSVDVKVFLIAGVFTCVICEYEEMLEQMTFFAG